MELDQSAADDDRPSDAGAPPPATPSDPRQLAQSSTVTSPGGASVAGSSRRSDQSTPGAAQDDLDPTVTQPGTPHPSDVPEPGLEEAKTVIRQPRKASASERPARTPAEIAQVLVGEHLNQYFLEALIGGGGMGAVFRARDQRLDRIVALKVVPFVGNDPELDRRFRNEAQNAAKLDHPRIARVFDAGDYDDWHYIVFEYIDGINLRDLVQDHGVLSLDDAVVFTSQVAEALDHAAQRGIVHRDIKPSNVLVSGDGSVKLVDMGLARSDNLDLSEDMTASGVTLGTFDYISPEQAFDPRDADIRSDLYSLGCTFYYMLTGEPPYTGGTMLQKLISHGKTPPPDPRQLRPDLPEEAVAVMHRMMAKDPQTRYQNARDLLADLNELAYRYGLKRAQSNAVVAPPVGNEGMQRLQLHLPWMIAFLLVLMVGGYLELQSTATREAFVVPRPVAGSRATSETAGGDASLDTGRDSDLRADVVAPETTERGDDDVVSPAPSSEMEDDSPIDRDGLKPGGSLDRMPDADSASNAAAQPPRFNAPLPPPPSSELTDVSPRNMAQDAIAPSDEEGEQGTPAADLMREDDAPPETADASGASADTAASSREPSGLPTPQAVRIVAPSVLSVATRVDQVDRDREDGAILASTLADAVDLAMRFGVGRVEIDVADLVTGPVAIPQDNMTFVSTAGRSLIRMVSINTLAIERSEMLNLGNHRTEFKNLDFHWELSQEQIDGGAMFVINDSRLTRFQNCTFTLVNPVIQDGVSFFEIVTDPEVLPDSDTLPGRMFNPDENALPFVALQLDNAIIRGEADLIEMDYAAALQLAWNNGLLAISGRGIDTAGARRRPGATAGSIQLSLSNVTAETPRGLLRMQLGNDGMHAVSIEREANQCVFLVDAGQPHIEVVNLESVSGERPEVSLRGEDNAYVGASTLDAPIVTLTDRQGDTATVRISELAASDDELRPRSSVRWSTPTPQANSQTYHRMTPNQYRQDGAIYFGFQELNLPPLP